MKLELLFKEVNKKLVKERRNVALTKRRLLNHSEGIDKDKYLILTKKNKYNTNAPFSRWQLIFVPLITKITLIVYQPKISLNFIVLKNIS